MRLAAPLPLAQVILALLSLAQALAAAAADQAPDPAATPEVPPEEHQLLVRLAREHTNSASLFALADYLHDRGVDGDKEAVPRAEAYLRQLLAADPTNAPALALLGSVYTLKGRDAFWPTTQIRLVREGNRYMDEAVDLAPADTQTRTIRALNNAHMPDFLGRAEIVRTDLAWLWERIGSEPDRFTTSQKQHVALHWGRRLKRSGQTDQARQVWKTGQALAPDTAVASEIAAELKKLR